MSRAFPGKNDETVLRRSRGKQKFARLLHEVFAGGYYGYPHMYDPRTAAPPEDAFRI